MQKGSRQQREHMGRGEGGDKMKGAPGVGHGRGNQEDSDTGADGADKGSADAAVKSAQKCGAKLEPAPVGKKGKEKTAKEAAKGCSAVVGRDEALRKALRKRG